MHPWGRILLLQTLPTPLSVLEGLSIPSLHQSAKKKGRALLLLWSCSFSCLRDILSARNNTYNKGALRLKTLAYTKQIII